MKTLLVAVVVLAAVGCRAETHNDKDRKTVEVQQAVYMKGQPVPAFDWSLERDTAIQLYKMRNERVRTWTVWRSQSGLIEGHCESLGFPLPYDVQLTNPMVAQQMVSGSGVVAVEQPEPNGLFSSKSTTATWVRSVVRHNGQVMEVPLYIESKVTCYPYPVAVDYEKNRVVRVEAVAPEFKLAPKQ